MLPSFISRKPRCSAAARKGFVLIAGGVMLVGLVATLGVVVDLGRAYIVRNEAQAFTDSAALSGALQLNGTLAGITAAQAAVAASANKWHFGSQPFSSVVTEFSTNKTTWVSNPATGAGYKYVRVTAPSNSLTVTFTRAITNQTFINVSARSIAGYDPPTTYPQGVFPFAPFAHSPIGPNFGYTFGDELTLLWPSSVQSNGQGQHMNNLCASDRSPTNLQMVLDGTIAERGYIQEPSAAAIRAAIEDDYMTYTVTLGLPVNRTGGVKTTDVYQALQNRVDQDTTSNQPDYNSYLSGHDSSPLRRVVIVPIIDNAINSIVLGFAYVFLPPNQPHNPNRSKCAMYIGPADLPVGNIATGANIVRMLQ